VAAGNNDLALRSNAAPPPASAAALPTATEAVYQAPLRTDDVIRARFDRLSPVEKIREYFFDPNTGVPNERGFDALHGQEKASAPLFAHFSVEGVKFINDHFGHDQGQLLYRMAALALAEADPNVCKVRGDFGSRTISAERANRVAEQATQNLPAEFRGFKITVRTGKTWEEASQGHAAAKEAQEKLGVRAPRGGRPKGVAADWTPDTTPFPPDRLDGPPHSELSKAYLRLDREQQLAAYRDPMTGLLSHTGMGAAARSGDRYLSIDVDGLKASDKFSSGLADEVIRQTGRIMGLLCGEELKAAHPHGDEFGAAHPSEDVLRAYAEQLDEYLRFASVRHTNVDMGVTFVQHGVGISYGIGATHEEAERALEQHKAARARAGERDVPGESRVAESRLACQPATERQRAEARAGWQRAHEHRELRGDGLGTVDVRRGERGAHAPGGDGIQGGAKARDVERRARSGDARGARAAGPSSERGQRVALVQGRGEALSIFPAIRAETLDALPFRGRSHEQAVGILWQSAVPKNLERIIIVERPVDALGHYQMKPDERALYVSVGPALTPAQKPALAQLVHAHHERSRALGEPPIQVVAAVSKSREGATLARQVDELRPPGTSFGRDVPSRGTYWHDTALAREREPSHGRDPVAAEPRGPRLSRQLTRS